MRSRNLSPYSLQRIQNPHHMRHLQLRVCCWLIAVCILAPLNMVKGEKLPIPLNFDKNAVQFVFTKVSDTQYDPMGTGFMVTVADAHKPTFFHRIPLPGLVFFTYKSKITQTTGYFVTAKHVLFDDNGHLRPNMYVRQRVRVLL